MRLIDANEVVKAILAERDKIPRTVPAAPYELVPVKLNQHGNSMRGGIRKALRCIEQTPTVDAVPVVRCRECKHYTHKEQGYFCTAFVGDDFNVRFENDFCSYGEPKEGAG